MADVRCLFSHWDAVVPVLTPLLLAARVRRARSHRDVRDGAERGGGGGDDHGAAALAVVVRRRRELLDDGGGGEDLLARRVVGAWASV